MRRWLVLLAFAALPITGHAQRASARGPAVVLIVTDGFRWQEMFTGADTALMGKAGGVADTAALAKDFWRESPDARRRAIWPFVWTKVTTGGTIWGQRMKLGK